LQDFNTQIRDVIVPKYESMGDNVFFVEQYSNFVDANGTIIHIGFDGLHPDQDGYDLMGDTWAAALRTALPAPVLLTGYSADVISDKDASARFAQPFGAGTFVWFETGAVDDDAAPHQYGLPAGLSFVSATGSRATYQLQPANAKNGLQLGAGQTGTLTLTAPAAYSTLYVLASSGDGTPSSVGSGTINFADSSTQAFSYNSFDWCNGQSGLHPEAVLSGAARAWGGRLGGLKRHAHSPPSQSAAPAPIVAADTAHRIFLGSLDRSEMIGSSGRVRV
jgi:hypothetical protein